MAKNNNLTDFVTDLADAIRAKCKTTGTINPQDFSKFVGGMPFFKFRETVDITSPSTGGAELPIYYGKTYVKGEVYLTNDSGLTGTGDDSAMIIANGNETRTLFSINNTADRISVSGYPGSLPVNCIAFFTSPDGGESLIKAGWHIKIDIYDLCMGNPGGENTKIDLNNATGRGA